jgi:hypothetical protein
MELSAFESVERTAQLAAGVDHVDAIARFKAAVAQIPNVAAKPAPEVSLLEINLLGTIIAVRPYCPPITTGRSISTRTRRSRASARKPAGPRRPRRTSRG